MPFDNTFDEVYAEIKAALKRIDFNCLRADDIFDNRPIMSTIVSQIISSHFVVADLTNKNPNVFYEVGIAHSYRDAPNVILISQNLESVPFDLRHLPILIYDPDNLRGLTSKLIKKILENKRFFEGSVVLRNKYSLKYSNEMEFEQVVDYLEGAQKEVWDVVLIMLGVSDANLKNIEIVNSIFLFRHDLSSFVRNAEHNLFKNLFVIFRDMLVFFSGIEGIREYVIDVIEKNKFSEFAIEDETNFGLVADLGLSLFSNPLFKHRSIKWIINYIARKKVAGIDLVRSRIESFIINSGDLELYESIINSLHSENDTLRENCADVIGELKMKNAVPNLIITLEHEANYYVARSIISAFGKIKEEITGKPIIDWINHHYDDLVANKHTYAIDYASNALSSIDLSHNTSYGEMLNNIISSKKQ